MVGLLGLQGVRQPRRLHFQVRAGVLQQVSGQEDLRGDGDHGQHGGHPDELVQRVQAARGAEGRAHQDPAGHGVNSEQWAGGWGGVDFSPRRSEAAKYFIGIYCQCR